MIKITNLFKSYTNDNKKTDVLKNISLSLPDKQFISILGPSGCGKTTLLNCLGGLDRFDSGDILVDNHSLIKMSEKELNSYRNSYIGFIFQNCYLIPQLSILDNIKLALNVQVNSQVDVNKKALDALRQVELEDIKDKKPNQISGGQAQRIAIARAIASDCKIILADEPTGALDSKNSLIIMKLLKELSKSKLVVMVTHNTTLANEFSDRMISLSDGEIIADKVINQEETTSHEVKDMKQSKLSLKMCFKLAFKNILSRKLKSLLTGIACSFGIIGIGFYLAINTGFSLYSNNLSSASASSLPVVVNAYNQDSENNSYGDKNSDVQYPDVDEIYPKVDVNNAYQYSYNNFSPKYFSYLTRLKEEGIVKDFTINYGNSYSYNLTTKFPQSIDTKHESEIREVNTTITSYNYYAYMANLPYNIFHVLYGDLDQYDLITGSMPQNKNELVLVVDKYNSVSFNILKNLGFYNMNDTQDDVSNTALSTKVTPIKFTSIINKEYKVFTNDEYYKLANEFSETDGMGNTREIKQYDSVTLTENFYSNCGTTLKIVGVIRPKSSSSLSMLAPALCYTSALQEEMVENNESSKISTTIKNNIVFKKRNSETETTDLLSFYNEINDALTEYFNSEDNSILPTSKINEIYSRYITYYLIKESGYYSNYSYFLNDAKKIGANLISDDLLKKDLSSESVIEEILSDVLKSYQEGNYDSFYDLIISFLAYINAYSQISSIIIFPTDLNNRVVLLNKLDEYNEIVEGDINHASNVKEQVKYAVSDAYSMLEEVGEMISLISVILIMFAAVSLIVSGAMTALLTSNNVLERRKEIGLLRALGARKIDIVTNFIIEATLLGILAGIIGSLFTFALSYPVNSILNYYLTYYHVESICYFTFYHSLICTGFSIAIAFISSLIPSIKASKQNPIESLRSE